MVTNSNTDSPGTLDSGSTRTPGLTKNAFNLYQPLLKTRPSRLCFTHQMSRKKRFFSWLKCALKDDDIRCYRVSKGLVCLYNTVYIIQCIYWKRWRFGRVTPMPHTLTRRQQNIVLLSLSKV